MFNIQCSTFNVQRSMFNVQCSTFNVQRSTFNVQRSSFIVHRSSFNVHRSTFIVQRSTFNVQRSSFNVQRSSFNVQRSMFNVQRDSTSTPCSVISRVCSHWALGISSSEITSQPYGSSASTKTRHVPILIIGSMVNTMPGTSNMPSPRCEKWATSGSSWKWFPTPWPHRSRPPYQSPDTPW